VGFVVDKVALGQVFPEYFGFACQFSFHRLLHIHLSSGFGKRGQILADVPSGLSLNPPQETKKKKKTETDRAIPDLVLVKKTETRSVAKALSALAS
jgi:hypothetical protein